MSENNLFEQQRSNRRRSKLLVAIFVLFFAWIGFGGDLAWFITTQRIQDGYRHTIPWIGLVTTCIGLGMAFFSWRRGPREVLWATGAWEMVEPTSEQETTLRNVVEEMAIASGLPVPTIWIVPDKDPNAFATGLDERHAHVAVTEGLLARLNRDQLQAVVAHEMAHIQNYDVRLMTLLAALVGTIALVSDAARRTMRLGGGRVGNRGRNVKGKNPLGLIVGVFWVISLLLAPLVSRLLALSVSRKREYLADATAAQFTRNPAALAEALLAIENAVAATTAIGRGSAHLCIADPLGRRLTHKQGFVADLLATHPPMAIRVARLQAMAFQQNRSIATADLETSR